jgi:hypothetical protein
MATVDGAIQPRTFAPSKEAVLENLSFFFGEPAVPEKLRDYKQLCRDGTAIPYILPWH